MKEMTTIPYCYVGDSSVDPRAPDDNLKDDLP